MLSLEQRIGAGMASACAPDERERELVKCSTDFFLPLLNPHFSFRTRGKEVPKRERQRRMKRNRRGENQLLLSMVSVRA